VHSADPPILALALAIAVALPLAIALALCTQLTPLSGSALSVPLHSVDPPIGQCTQCPRKSALSVLDIEPAIGGPYTTAVAKKRQQQISLKKCHYNVKKPYTFTL
jgi:hypothetical protein